MAPEGVGQPSYRMGTYTSSRRVSPDSLAPLSSAECVKPLTTWPARASASSSEDDGSPISDSSSAQTMVRSRLKILRETGSRFPRSSPSRRLSLASSMARSTAASRSPSKPVTRSLGVSCGCRPRRHRADHRPLRLLLGARLDRAAENVGEDESDPEGEQQAEHAEAHQETAHRHATDQAHGPEIGSNPIRLE